MKAILFLFLLGSLVWAAPPLLVTAVERTGLPPYDEGSERVYRLEGPGCPTLRVGELLKLQRSGERRTLGRLEILSVHLDHAKARLSVPGDTFPLKGDLAIRTELLRPLPEAALVVQDPIPPLEILRPRTILRAWPDPPGQEAVVYREPIYFIPGDASLSPGALIKLRTWAETWGAKGRWSLECPYVSGLVTALRIEALRSELRRLGVQDPEVSVLPEEPPGRYETIYVKMQPW